MNEYLIIVRSRLSNDYVVERQSQKFPIVSIPDNMSLSQDYHHSKDELIEMFLDSMFFDYTLVRKEYVSFETLPRRLEGSFELEVENVIGLQSMFSWKEIENVENEVLTILLDPVIMGG